MEYLQEGKRTIGPTSNAIKLTSRISGCFIVNRTNSDYG